jgi:LysM repeat protein
LLAQASDTSGRISALFESGAAHEYHAARTVYRRVPAGKANEVVALFKRGPASKINNSNLANSSAGENWQTISNRTGVPVEQLMAANPGMAVPRGKVFVPQIGNNVNRTAYTRPTTPSAATQASNVRVLKAQAGDTVAKVAQRAGANATEVAKFNGLLPNSVLPAGREIKIPAN